MSIDNRRDRVAKALADFDQTPFGEMTLTKPDGTDPRIIDTRTAYRREAERFMAMLNAATEPSTTDAIMALLPSLPDGWVAVPEEPTEEIIEAMNAAYLSTRRHGVSGQSIEAVWRAKYGPEIVAYRAMLSARPTPPTEPPREWDMREATLNQSGCEVLIAFESAARACQFFDDVMEHPVLVPLPAPPEPLETER